jgi:hypothetical protein
MTIMTFLQQMYYLPKLDCSSEQVHLMELASRLFCN